jgi:hypothetical protein
MTISNEVQSLESQNESLQAENRLLNNARILNEFELSELRRANARLQSERDAAMDSASQMKVILDQAGAAIVQGMNRFYGGLRLKQEEALIDSTSTPLFLQDEESRGGEE